jgi:TrmH family RNA methyltransferase
MLTKSKIKLLQSLRLKKYRQKYNIFLVEGHKSVVSLFHQAKYTVNQIYATSTWKDNHGIPAYEELTTISDYSDLKKISDHKSSPEVIAEVEIPDHVDTPELTIQRAIYLDNVQDPGNVGAIIRIADWYGIDTVIRSEGSADFYSGKVIQSCMGSFANMNLHTCSQSQLIELTEQTPLIVAAMDGDPLQDIRPLERFILAMGSEGQGISELLIKEVKQAITIAGVEGRIADSLNVSVATGIICDRLCQ